MRHFFTIAMALPIAAWAAPGCYGSVGVVGTADSGTDTGAGPDAGHDTVADLGTDTVVDTVTPPSTCSVDSDCAILDPIDCCNGCPVVALRGEASDHPCHHERGTPVPDPMPVECMMDCFACPPCFPQPIAAACEAGTCIASAEGCPYPYEPDPPAMSPAVIAADPSAFSGGAFTLSGSVIARWPVCDDYCPGTTPCCDVALYLDGVVRLAGWPCDASMTCTSSVGCPYEWDCGSLAEGRSYEVMGEISVASAYEPPSIVVSGIREIPPPGYGGAYAVTVTSAMHWADDPGVDCIRTPVPGDSGRLVLADADGAIVITNDLFQEAWVCEEYWGTRSGSAFEAQIPILCEGCCCDYWFEGTLGAGGAISGTYFSFDGVCHSEVVFTGAREE